VTTLETGIGMQIWPGDEYPLGATWDGGGTNFSIFSEAAERVELCLFGDTGDETRVDLPPAVGAQVFVRIPPDRLHLFNGRHGARLP